MPIPKAPKGEEFAYYFQNAVFVKREGNGVFFLDSYLYEPLFAPIYTEQDTYIAAEDLVRIYAPDLSCVIEDGIVKLNYAPPLGQPCTVEVNDSVCRKENGTVYLPVIGIMGNGFGKKFLNDAGFSVVQVDGKEDPAGLFHGFIPRKRYLDRLNNKKYGELNFTYWHEEANRLLAYRMYIPFSYDPVVPNKTLVCFHGGDANADYMFKHTNNEIQNYAEREGYILLALCSYRKYTFFGASRLPNNKMFYRPNDPNPVGLTEEELEWCEIAERSVALQLEDAKKRYNLDTTRMYALGNSGGSMGIFRQVGVLPKNTFRAVICSGGCPYCESVGVENLRTKGTKFLLLLASEDEYAGQDPYTVDYPYLKENGLDIEFCAIGGGTHLLGWTHALDTIFSFYRKNA